MRTMIWTILSTLSVVSGVWLLIAFRGWLVTAVRERALEDMCRRKRWMFVKSLSVNPFPARFPDDPVLGLRSGRVVNHIEHEAESLGTPFEMFEHQYVVLVRNKQRIISHRVMVAYHNGRAAHNSLTPRVERIIHRHAKGRWRITAHEIVLVERGPLTPDAARRMQQSTARMVAALGDQHQANTWERGDMTLDSDALGLI